MTTGIAHGTNAVHDTRRARVTGLLVAGLGILLFNISPFLNWVNPEDGSDPRTGYETDSLVPFIAYLGLGLLVALLWATKLARRAQHRGLTLVTLAVGIAAALQSLAFGINPMGGLERGDDLAVDLGVWIAFIGALLWAAGAGMLAKEIEGDDDGVKTHDRDASAR